MENCETFYLIITRNKVSKERLPWHSAVGLGSLNRGFGDQPVLPYLASFFCDFRQSTSIFLPLALCVSCVVNVGSVLGGANLSGTLAVVLRYKDEG